MNNYKSFFYSILYIFFIMKEKYVVLITNSHHLVGNALLKFKPSRLFGKNKKQTKNENENTLLCTLN